MATATADGGGGWFVRCRTCNVKLAEGDGQPPAQLQLEGNQRHAELEAVTKHIRESGGVHQVEVVRRGRVTEKR